LTRVSILLRKNRFSGWMAGAFAAPKRLRPRRRVKPGHDEFFLARRVSRHPFCLIVSNFALNPM